MTTLGISLSRKGVGRYAELDGGLEIPVGARPARAGYCYRGNQGGQVAAMIATIWRYFTPVLAHALLEVSLVTKSVKNQRINKRRSVHMQLNKTGLMPRTG